MEKFIVDLECSARFTIEAETEKEAEIAAMELWEEFMPNCYITKENT